MKIEDSYHWKKQKEFRPEITNDLIELCIENSERLIDRKWEDAFNAISRISPSGRILKVVYKEFYKEGSKSIKILTAYWLN